MFLTGGGHYNPANPHPRTSFFHKGHVVPKPANIPVSEC